jgi:hypothetical protein
MYDSVSENDDLGWPVHPKRVHKKGGDARRLAQAGRSAGLVLGAFRHQIQCFQREVSRRFRICSWCRLGTRCFTLVFLTPDSWLKVSKIRKKTSRNFCRWHPHQLQWLLGSIGKRDSQEVLYSECWKKVQKFRWHECFDVLLQYFSIASVSGKFNLKRSLWNAKKFCEF